MVPSLDYPRWYGEALNCVPAGAVCSWGDGRSSPPRLRLVVMQTDATHNQNVSEGFCHTAQEQMAGFKCLGLAAAGSTYPEQSDFPDGLAELIEATGF